jgi:hypothetical protein
MHKSVSLSVQTWKKLWELKLSTELGKLDDVVYTAASILDMVVTLFKKYHMPEPDQITGKTNLITPDVIVEFARDMVLHYDEYLRGKYKRVVIR